jgi:hypothetical protein
MSVDSSFSNDLAYVAQPTESKPTLRLRPDRIRGLSPLVLVAAALPIIVAVIAAIATGANIALSILVGYCALAGTIAVMLTAVRASQPQQVPYIIGPAPTPGDTTAAWKLVTTFTVSDASRLLCNIEPGAAATQESIAWGRALIDAIKQGELPFAATTGAAQVAIDRERENPHYMTEVTRDALRAWADQRGAVPEFLRS